MAAEIDELRKSYDLKNSKFLIVMMCCVGPLYTGIPKTVTIPYGLSRFCECGSIIKNFEFLTSQLFLDASVLAAMAVKL